jgi:hypothetical protein
MKTRTITFLMALMACVTFAQHDHAAHGQASSQNTVATFKDSKLGAAYNQYLQLKDALVASNTEDAKKAALELQKALKDAKGTTASLDAVAKFVKAGNLNEQREIFSLLSNEMTSMVKGGKLSSGTLYLEYCPMANNNTGAYWLSNEKQIKNPYFGDMMLKCGSVKETIQ